MTLPFECAGGDLEINASARGSHVSVAVLDEEGFEHAGFARVCSALFDGDSVCQRMKWKDAVFDTLKGQRIQLKFYLQNASLYAFRQTGERS